MRGHVCIACKNISINVRCIVNRGWCKCTQREFVVFYACAGQNVIVHKLRRFNFQILKVLRQSLKRVGVDEIMLLWTLMLCICKVSG